MIDYQTRSSFGTFGKLRDTRNKHRTNNDIGALKEKASFKFVGYIKTSTRKEITNLTSTKAKVLSPKSNAKATCKLASFIEFPIHTRSQHFFIFN